MDMLSNEQKLWRSIEKDKIEKVVLGATIFRRRKVLLLKRAMDDFMGGLVELPSGGLDASDKSLSDALTREIVEETGLCPEKIGPYLGSFDYLSGKGKKSRQLNFLVKIPHGKVALNPAEHSAFFWVRPTAENLKRYTISSSTKRIINKAATLYER